MDLLGAGDLSSDEQASLWLADERPGGGAVHAAFFFGLSEESRRRRVFGPDGFSPERIARELQRHLRDTTRLQRYRALRAAEEAGVSWRGAAVDQSSWLAERRSDSPICVSVTRTSDPSKDYQRYPSYLFPSIIRPLAFHLSGTVDPGAALAAGQQAARQCQAGVAPLPEPCGVIIECLGSGDGAAVASICSLQRLTIDAGPDGLILRLGTEAGAAKCLLRDMLGDVAQGDELCVETQPREVWRAGKGEAAPAWAFGPGLSPLVVLVARRSLLEGAAADGLRSAQRRRCGTGTSSSSRRRRPCRG